MAKVLYVREDTHPASVEVVEVDGETMLSAYIDLSEVEFRGDPFVMIQFFFELALSLTRANIETVYAAEPATAP